MKILITSTNQSIDSQMDQRFCRARWFSVWDTETGNVEFISNEQNLQAMQGAGIQSGQNAVKLGVEVVLTGHIGPKAFQVLNAAGIKIFQVSDGSIADVYAQYKSGNLTPMESSDKPGHW